MSVENNHISEFTLKINSAKKAFGEVEVLRGINLEIKAGERIALMGPSGSGKSTLLNCICGIEPLDAGNLEVGGKELSGLKPMQIEKIRREQIGYIFQSFHLLPTLNAFENVEFSAQLVGMEKSQRNDRVMELLTRVGLNHRLEHLPNEMSGGERQRVAIARGVINNPKVIFADEPTSALDDSNTEIVMKMIFDYVKKNNSTLVVCTHDDRVKKFFSNAMVIK